MGQYEIKGILLVVFLVISVIVILKVTKLSVKILTVAVLFCLFVVGSNIVDLNYLSPEIQGKIDAVVATVGDSFIKTSGNSVLIKIGDEWCDLSKIAVIGDLATESVVIEYDGKKLYVGETGLVNVLRVLESMGLVQSE